MEIGPMAGRTVLITGGSGGIGRTTALNSKRKRSPKRSYDVTVAARLWKASTNLVDLTAYG